MTAIDSAGAPTVASTTMMSGSDRRRAAAPIA
jgi:hypothetical protein